MNIVIGVVVFVLGTAIGSFLNVVIYRLHAGGSPLRGRSRCPHCKHQLAADDLIPVLSFVMLRRRCRYCHKPISWQYPLVELSMGLVALTMMLRYGLSVESWVGTVLGAFLLVIFVYDLRHQLILDRVSIPAMVAALLGSLLLKRPLTDIAIGGVAGAAFFFLQYVFSNGRWIGGGDIRLGAVLGLALGWKLLAVSLVLAYFGGSTVALFLILTKRRSWSSQIPFGTFLSLAGIVTFLWGNEILVWYLHGGFFDWFVGAFLRFYNPAV
ncbi:MAG: prepilin peptidase [Candidatus Kerfeldbacteria bacterium]|nr:prepilin peptidase [Candidatus Kerfeldbacteria bacterium]